MRAGAARAMPIAPASKGRDVIGFAHGRAGGLRHADGRVQRLPWGTRPRRPAVRAEENFQRFLESLWPQAQAYGVTRKTFDTALRGLEPDLTLPDLVRAGRDKPVEKGQAEFTRAPQGVPRQGLPRSARRRGQDAAAPARRRARSSASSASTGTRCWPSGAARRRSATISCRTTPSAFSQRKPGSGGARRCSNRAALRAQDAGGRCAARRTCAPPGRAPWA